MAHIDIKIRYSTGAYHASAPGRKETASSAMSGEEAGTRLLKKLAPGVLLDRTELLSPGTYPEATIVRFHLGAHEKAQSQTTAYCFGSGNIQFGALVPEGAIALAVGNEDKVREIIGVTAQLSRQDNETLFVPGVADAPNQREGLTALARYIQWLGQRNQPGFRALGV